MDHAVLARFEAKVQPEPMSGCWLWVGALNQAGYGQLYEHGKVKLAHRMAYRHWIGRIRPGLVIDHKCAIRACVNPDHLQAVTFGRNIWLGFNRDGKPTKPRKPMCGRGLHKMEGGNVIDRNGRTCRECKLAGWRRYYYERHKR